MDVRQISARSIVVVCVSTVVLLQGCSGDASSTTVSTTLPMTLTSTSSATNNTSTASTTTTIDVDSLWKCKSTRHLPAVVAADKKGMAMDDVTMESCMNEVGIWPHSAEPIKTIRLFAGWKDKFDGSKRDAAWDNIEKYVKDANAKVLIGVENNNQIPDPKSWDEAFELMKRLGPDHVMGVAFGNEMDLKVEQGKIQHSFFDRDGALISLMKTAIDAMDKAGFQDVPITTVFTAGIIANLGKYPFLKQGQETWPSRWVYSYNPYSIWDKNIYPHNGDDCDKMTDIALSLEYVTNGAANLRDQLNDFVGNDDYRIWLTEAGWSAGVIGLKPHPHIESFCPRWGDKESLWTMYQNLMSWDLSLPDGDQKHIDHLFFFSMRDANGNWIEEHFGLVKKCGDVACKIDGTSETLLV